MSLSRRRWMAGSFGLGLFAGAPALAAPQPTVLRPFKVVLDPGHGGDNAGCVAADGVAREKDLTLSLALQVRERVREMLPHAELALTRETDISLPLASRVVAANELDADVLISLHANASPSHQQEGYETYVLDTHAAERNAAWVAATDASQAGARTHGEVAAIQMLNHLQSTANQQLSLWIAGALQRGHRERFPRRLDRGVKSAAFDVLLGARMPAVLHEVGFLDHKDESQLLLDRAGQRAIAEMISEAIVAYYRYTSFRLS